MNQTEHICMILALKLALEPFKMFQEENLYLGH